MGGRIDKGNRRTLRPRIEGRFHIAELQFLDRRLSPPPPNFCPSHTSRPSLSTFSFARIPPHDPNPDVLDFIPPICPNIPHIISIASFPVHHIHLPTATSSISSHIPIIPFLTSSMIQRLAETRKHKRPKNVPSIILSSSQT